MKRILTLILAMAFCYTMIGSPIDEATAKQFAQNFWRENNIMAVRNGKVYKQKPEEARFVNVAPQHGYSAFYIFNNTAGKGYVIMAADDCVIPILGYSYENNFGDGELPPNFKAWLDNYAMQIEDASAMKLNATEEIRKDWECIRLGKTLPIKSEKTVGPLVQTRWSQSPYYNNLCPYDNSAHERAVTGCVATAMAQVMRYWSHPAHGLGNHSYVPSSHPEYGTLYADFSSVTYDWNNMPNRLGYDSQQTQVNAVATLMYHCGVGVEMMYGTTVYPDSGSAAYIINYNGSNPCAETALKTYFDYKSTMHGEKKNDHSDTEWIQILKNELDNSRPMIYGGFSNSGGHAFVCDGYNSNNYFHFNWGWGGSYDDYFYINSLNPGSHSYSQNQQALIGIEPNQNGGGGGGGGGGGTSSFNLAYHNDLSMNSEFWFYDNISVYAAVANSGNANFNGYIGAAVFWENNENEYIFFDVMNAWNFTSSALPPGYYKDGNLTCAGGPPYLPGSYAVAMVYSLDGELWNNIDNNNYNDAYFDIVYEQDIETYSDFEILTGDYLYYGTTSTVNVNIWNSGTDTFYGKFRVNLANLDGSWAQNIAILNCSNGLDSGYYYDGGLDFTGEITVEPGSYYMELAYQMSGDPNWYYAGAYAYQNPVRVEVVAAPVSVDPYEANNSASSAYRLPFNITGVSTTVSTTGSNLHNNTDIDYYKIELNSGRNYTILPRLHDSYNTGNSTYYTVDAMFAYSTDGVNWSEYCDDVMAESFTVSGGTLYFCVVPYFEGRTGSYLLDIKITQGTGVEETDETLFSVYPNPTKDVVNVSCTGIEEIRLFNAVGQRITCFGTEGRDNVQLNMSDLPDGVYILQAFSQGHTLTQRIVKAE